MPIMRPHQSCGRKVVQRMSSAVARRVMAFGAVPALWCLERCDSDALLGLQRRFGDPDSGCPHSLLTERDGDGASLLDVASEIGRSRALPVGAKIFRRQRFGLIIGSVVLATLAFSGYWAYRQRHSIADSSSPAPTPAPAIYRDKAAADDAKEGKAERSVEVPGIAISSPQVPLTAARVTASGERVDRDVVKPSEAASALPAGVKRQKTANAAARTERQQPNLGPCTEAIAALGLCTPEPARTAQ